MENLRDNEDISRTWENVEGNIKPLAKESLGRYEWKQHEPRFDEECLKVFRLQEAG